MSSPIPRDTLADRLTVELRKQIESSRIGPGQPVPTERELCARFGVGRTTVREALHGLIAIGVVERRNGSLFVRDAPPTEDDEPTALAASVSVAELYETRKAIEGRAVELAAQRNDRADLAKIRSALDRMRDASGDAFHAADVEFHFAVVRAAKNSALLRIYQDAEDLFFGVPALWRRMAGRPQPNALAGWEGHREVADAIERGDGAKAAQLTNEMLDGVSELMIRRLERALGARDAS